MTNHRLRFHSPDEEDPFVVASSRRLGWFEDMNLRIGLSPEDLQFVVLIAIILCSLVCGFGGGYLGGERGRGTAGFWFGLLFGPAGLICAGLLKKKEEAPANGDYYSQTVSINDLSAYISTKAGVGITVDSSDSRRVAAVAKDSSAKTAGIRVNDRIVSINGEFVKNERKDDILPIVLALVGEPGSEVTITVRRDVTPHTFTMTRA